MGYSWDRYGILMGCGLKAAHPWRSPRFMGEMNRNTGMQMEK